MGCREYDVSVIIPVYNTGAFLEECLNSVIQQEKKSLEIICINDGSTDNSAEILKSYSEKHENIKVYEQVNKGLSFSRNRGMIEASGKYIYFLDSDDYIDSSALKELYDYAENQCLDVLCFDAEIVYDSKDAFVNGKMSKRYYTRSKEYGVSNEPMKMMDEMLSNNDYKASVCLQLYNSSFLRENEIMFSDGLLYEDNLFTFQTFLLAHKVGHVKKEFYKRRIRDNSITTTKKDWKHFWGLFKSYLEMENIIDKKADILDKADFALATKVAERMLASARNVYRYSLSDKEREELNKLPQWYLWKIQQRVVEWNVQQDRDNMYPFPYYLIAPDSKLVIYGAGNIGKAYYCQLQKTKYAQVVKWIDKNYASIRDEWLPVSEIDFEGCEFDKIIISVANEQVVMDITDTLSEKGVPRDKIVWAKDEYTISRKKQFDKVYNHLDIYRQFCESQAPKIYLYMTPEHGNLGDYAIALAEREFFKRYFKEYVLVEVTMPQWQRHYEEYKKIVSLQDLVCISGGGYLGNLWDSGRIMKEIIEAFPENLKVLFPNTLTYIDNNEIEMQEDAKFFSRQKNLMIMARDKASYERLLKYQYQKGENIYFYPDMALFLQYSLECGDRKGIAVCLRDDIERDITPKEYDEIIQILKNFDAYCVETDIHLHRRVPRESGEYEILRKIDEIKRYKLVVTDRLHGMIFAVISGTPCIAFDNVTHKVSGVYEWLKNIPYIYYCKDINTLNLVIKELLDLPECKYNVEEVLYMFKKMASDIKEKYIAYEKWIV